MATLNNFTIAMILRRVGNARCPGSKME